MHFNLHQYGSLERLWRTINDQLDELIELQPIIESEGEDMRFVIEGEWSRYTSSQQRVVHRVVTDRQDIVEWVRKTHAIRYTDGTSLVLSVRPCTFREKVVEIHGYDLLIDKCRLAGCDSVQALIDRKEVQK